MAKKIPKGLANLKMAMEMSVSDKKKDKGKKEMKVEKKEVAKVKKKSLPFSSQNKKKS